jgi:hypothetical protein
MDIASLIISIVSLLLSISSLVWLLAKQLSSHTIQYVDPFAGKGQDPLTEQMGKDPTKEFRELGEPLDDDEISYMEEMRKKKVGR